MQREIAEQIMQAMEGFAETVNRLDKAVWLIEDEDERRRLLRFIAGLVFDSYHHLTLPVVNEFPELHPHPDPPFRPLTNFKPGLPVRRIDPGPRQSDATIHDDRMYLSGVIPKDTSQDIAGQTKQVLGEIDALLEKGGSYRGKVLSALIFLADMNEFAGMNAVWDDWIVAYAPPVCATVESRLVDPKMKVEIMVVAALVPGGDLSEEKGTSCAASHNRRFVDDR